MASARARCSPPRRSPTRRHRAGSSRDFSSAGRGDRGHDLRRLVPHHAGHYSYNGQAFAAQFDNAPLHALAERRRRAATACTSTGRARSRRSRSTPRTTGSTLTFTNTTGPPPTAPGAPTGVTATAGNASATVSWTAPASNGGARSRRTRSRRSSAPPRRRRRPSSGAAGHDGHDHRARRTARAYTFTVAATNSVGTGPASAASNAVTPTAAAQVFTLFGNSVPEHGRRGRRGRERGARPQVHRRRLGFRHRRALLQVGREHRHPHRRAVVGDRHPTCDGHVHERDGLGLADRPTSRARSR